MLHKCFGERLTVLWPDLEATDGGKHWGSFKLKIVEAAVASVPRQGQLSLLSSKTPSARPSDLVAMAVRRHLQANGGALPSRSPNVAFGTRLTEPNSDGEEAFCNGVDITPLDLNPPGYKCPGPPVHLRL